MKLFISSFLFSLSFILTRITIIQAKPVHSRRPPPPPPPPTDSIDTYCKDDISKYCPQEGPGGNLNVIYCLKVHESDLSSACRSKVGNTFFGGCNNDAQRLCGEFGSVSEIYSCLKDKKEELSQKCLANIENQQKNAVLEAQQRLRHVTRAITAMSILYLCIPLLVGYWVWRKVRMLSEIHKSMEDKQQMTASVESSVRQAAVDESNAVLSDLPARADTNAPQCCVSFYQLNYWVATQGPIFSVDRLRAIVNSTRAAFVSSSKLSSRPDRLQSKKILSDLTGMFRPAHVTAVMGPSGSGKTTLLKVMAGQMRGGELSGKRMINGVSLSTQSYDMWIAKQGYVAQQDSHADNLTVWQTLMFAAMLRLPETLWTPAQKLERAREVMHDLGLDSIADTSVGGRASSFGHTMMLYGAHRASINATHASSGVGGGISGGQKRRLSIAIELLTSPPVIFLDEPTSGLDATSSLQIVRNLRDCSRGWRGTTVILTVHQPRTEVFSLFDELILLGAGGKLVYSGSAKDQAPMRYLTSAAGPHIGTLPATDNPADFMIDLLGTDENIDSNSTGILADDGMSANDHGIELSSIAANEYSSLSVQRKANNLTETLCLHFRSSARYQSMESDIENQSRIAEANYNLFPKTRRQISSSSSNLLVSTSNPLFSSNNSRDGYLEVTTLDSRSEVDEELGCDTSIDISLHPNESLAKEGSQQDVPAEIIDRSNVRRKTMATMPSIFGMEELQPEEAALAAITASFTEVAVKQRAGAIEQNSSAAHVASSRTNSLWTQLWITCWRRALMFSASKSELGWFIVQMLGVSLVVTKTMSYQVENDLERPYQALMLIFLISTYAMIIQYLQLVPEYMSERQVLLREYSLRVAGPGSYCFAAMLTEVPRSVAQCWLLLTVVYTLHPLNPVVVNKCFCYVGLMVGVCAWQSSICFCCALTDDLAFVYTLIFLLLGSGSLFGGLLIRFSKIPALFRSMYYLSAVSVTQRALIVNDMQCCYLTTTCNSLAHSFKEDNQFQQPVIVPTGQNSSIVVNSFCPPGIAFSGDGSDEGNLGRLYLKILGLDQDNPFIGLFILFIATICVRLFAVMMLHYRQLHRHQLKQRDVNSS